MKAVGIINIALGGITALFSIISLLVLSFQMSLLKNITMYEPAISGIMVIELFKTIHTLYFIFTPVFIILGIGYIIGGAKLLSRKPAGVEITRITAIVIIVAYIVYSITMFTSIRGLLTGMPKLNEIVSQIMLGSLIISGIIIIGYQIFLLLFVKPLKQKPE